MNTIWKTCVSGVRVAALCLTLAGCAVISAIDPATYLKNITVQDVDLSALPPATYEGQYTLVLPSGQYAVNRHFDVLVAISSSHAYSSLTIKDPSSLDSDSSFTAFKGRIIASNSLLVDGVSGATYSSKAMLKAIEAAVTR